MEEGRINGTKTKKTELKKFISYVDRMPPKRTSTSETSVITLDAIRQLINDGISSALKSKKENYKEFINCQPFYFNGTEGVVDPHRCLRSKKMEDEILRKLMEAFIGGLPQSIEGNVTASKPQTLEEAINISQRLMDQIIKRDSVQETNDYKRKLEDKGNINRRQETFKIYTATNGYTGNRPLCVNRCTLHYIVLVLFSAVLATELSVVVVRPGNTRHRWDETCLLDIIVIKSTDVVGMALLVQNINHSAFRLMFEKEKLSGNNFNDWFARLKLVLRVEKKMHVIEQLLPPAPEAVAEPDIVAQWTALYDAHTKITCLMLGSMTPELHRQFKLHYPYDMIQELRSMFKKQARVKKFDLI
ncbi:hypothetical protein Tco_0790495 [Tanacetum coccineum]